MSLLLNLASFSPEVQYIINQQAKFETLTQEALQNLLGNGIDELKSEDVPLALRIIDLSIGGLEDAVVWAAGDRTFESWQELYLKHNQHPDLDIIDPTGTLRALGEDIINAPGLEDYFNQIITVSPFDELEIVLDGLKGIREIVAAKA